MPDSQNKNSFIETLTEIVEDNLSNEQFGVSELASRIGMSRSNLLRKVNKITGQSVSLFIREIRLKHGMKLLKEEELTVSEVGFKVGFNSTSYFIKCFHEYYGYPPGEAGKREQAQTRQLAAIMFTDIEGYTALMQRDEKTAIVFRNKHRDTFNPLVNKFQGNILQYYGDGTLSTFSSAIDAVRCAIEMQLAFQNEEPKIPVRIGIHIGDIVLTEDDIIGDGVNIAARIEALACSGGIAISEKVYDEVKNKDSIQTHFLGEFELKNVEKEVGVYAISNTGIKIPGKDDIIGEKAKIKRKGKQQGSAKGILTYLLATVILLSLAWFIFNSDLAILGSDDFAPTDKSIAVLPFINDSDDSSNVYIINGLMESILNKLQKVEDLRVISRTSVEKYRNTDMSLPEIARELNVRYFVEGSGQKIDDQIMLSIQLIEAPGDKHLWSEQYQRQVINIFSLQNEVANKIATNVEAVITPEEEERMNKVPTENLVAYDFFLKGLDLLYSFQYENYRPAIRYFKQAIQEDPEFARAYAAIAISYYRLDEVLKQKSYNDSIQFYSDQALLLDNQLAQSLISKAVYYINSDEFDLALPYLERALDYNPNSELVIAFLIDYYVTHMPDTEKYLEYALKGTRIHLISNDSVQTSFAYLHLANAFIQSGFIAEAEKWINQSLKLNPENLFSSYVKAYISYARDHNLKQLNKSLIKTLEKDTTRFDVLQEVAKSFYYLREFDKSYAYYEPFMAFKETYQLDMYKSEDAKIAVVLDKVGKSEKSDQYFTAYKFYADNDPSIYRHLSLAVYNAYHNKPDEAVEHLRLFSKQDNFHYWIILFLEIDPLVDNIKHLPEFKAIMKDIKHKFQIYHEGIKESLEEKRLL